MQSSEKLQPPPKTSVIIPTYRHGHLILRTLKSVFGQSTSDYEIIVVNDGSPDDTGQILSPLVDQGKIRYFEQANRGQAAARNFGLQHARGSLIAFLDDDDLWPPDKLQWQMEFLERNPEVGMVGGTYQTIDDQGQAGYRGPFHPSITFESLFGENPFLSPGQTTIRSKLFKELGGMNTNIWGADDWDLWFRIAKRSRIVMLDQPALYYRLHSGNSSKQVARLLRNACSTSELHLRSISGSRRRQLRAICYCMLYEGLGSLIVNQARGEVRRLRVLAATKNLAGLFPLAKGLCVSASLWRKLMHDFFTVPLRNRFQALRQ